MKTRMNRLGLLAVVGMVLGIGSATQAATLVYLTFDNSTVGPATDTYTPGAGEITPPTGTWNLLNTSKRPDIVASTGPQGGNALQVSGTTKVGYSSNSGSQIQLPAKTGFTAEILVSVDANSNGAIFTLGWSAYPQLRLVQGMGNMAQLQVGTIATASLPIVDGDFHAFAMVYDDIALTMSIYVDGVQQAGGAYSNIAYVNVGGTNIGAAQYGHQAAFTGKIDAFALSDTGLAPADFVLQIPEPATLGLLALGGLMVIGRKR